MMRPGASLPAGQRADARRLPAEQPLPRRRDRAARRCPTARPSSICAAASCRRRSASRCCRSTPWSQGDRLDNLAARYLGDPEQFWRLCDANGAMRPDELTQTSARRLRITLPEGVPGVRRMLAKGIHLTLLIGPVVPLPAPRVVLDALRERRGDAPRPAAPSGFQLDASSSPQALAAEHALPARRRQRTSMHPPLRVILVVTINGTPQRADRRRDDQRQQMQPGSQRRARHARPSPART